MPWGRLGQVIFPALLVVSPLMTLAPLVVMAVGAVAPAPAWLTLGAAIALAAQLLTWAIVNRFMATPARYALLFPLGAAVLGIIAAQAIARGARVEWKGRSYITTSRDPRSYR